MRRLNPDGVTLGAYPRGWHPSYRNAIDRFYYDVVPVRTFIETFGRDALDQLPSGTLIHIGHRKAISRKAFMNFVPAGEVHTL